MRKTSYLHHHFHCIHCWYLSNIEFMFFWPSGHCSEAGKRRIVSFVFELCYLAAKLSAKPCFVPALFSLVWNYDFCDWQTVRQSDSLSQDRYPPTNKQKNVTDRQAALINQRAARNTCVRVWVSKSVQDFLAKKSTLLDALRSKKVMRGRPDAFEAQHHKNNQLQNSTINLDQPVSKLNLSEFQLSKMLTFGGRKISCPTKRESNFFGRNFKFY